MVMCGLQSGLEKSYSELLEDKEWERGDRVGRTCDLVGPFSSMIINQGRTGRGIGDSYMMCELTFSCCNERR